MSDINLRLKKVVGQLNGLLKMIDEKQDCAKIIIQFQAAKAALENAFSLTLSENLSQCLRTQDDANLKKILHIIAKQ